MLLAPSKASRARAERIALAKRALQTLRAFQRTSPLEQELSNELYQDAADVLKALRRRLRSLKNAYEITRQAALADNSLTFALHHACNARHCPDGWDPAPQIEKHGRFAQHGIDQMNAVIQLLEERA
jgi:hypothetical protein